MQIKRIIKGIKNDVQYYLNGGIERCIEQKRLEKYEAIIYKIISEENRKSSDKTMMIKGPRKSDELTTNRAIHQNRASAIAGIVADKLGLNTRIIEIATQNHDLGHTPYGHSMEWWESEIFKDIGMGYRCHNAIGAKRLVYSTDLYDKIIEEIKAYNPKLSDSKLNKIRKSLWLVVDPILCHNGESSKRKLMIEPNLQKTEADFERELRQCYITEGYDRTLVPGTAEGSLLRIVDIISYVGQDMVDGLREGLITNFDSEYRQLLVQFGITEEEIELALAKKYYDGLARKIETEATKDLIQNSSKNRIQMSEKMLDLVCKLKDKNNKEIVNKVVRPTENEVYPQATRKLLNQFSEIFVQENLEEIMCELGNDKQKIEQLKARYEGTPYENFILHLCNTTAEDYLFTLETTQLATKQAVIDELNEAIDGTIISAEKYPVRAKRIEEMRADIEQLYPNGMTEEEKKVYVNRYIEENQSAVNTNFISMSSRIGMALGANYIETLSDREFVQLLEATDMLTPEQLADIKVKYKELSEEELEKDTIQDAWKAIQKRIEKEDQGMEP